MAGGVVVLHNLTTAGPVLVAFVDNEQGGMKNCMIVDMFVACSTWDHLGLHMGGRDDQFCSLMMEEGAREASHLPSPWEGEVTQAACH